MAHFLRGDKVTMNHIWGDRIGVIINIREGERTGGTLYTIHFPKDESNPETHMLARDSEIR